jgi:hypothetical protein
MLKTASSVARHDNTMSQPEESSETFAATVAPYRIRSSALPRSRSYAVNLKPASSNLRAIGRPM